jgi:hypothetical protein
VQGSSPEWIEAVFEASFFRSYSVLVAASVACAVAGARLAREPLARGAQLGVAAAGRSIGGAFTVTPRAGSANARRSTRSTPSAARRRTRGWRRRAPGALRFAARARLSEGRAAARRALFAGCVGVLVAIGTALAIPYLGSWDALVDCTARCWSASSRCLAHCWGSRR